MMKKKSLKSDRLIVTKQIVLLHLIANLVRSLKPTFVEQMLACSNFLTPAALDTLSNVVAGVDG